MAQLKDDYNFLSLTTFMKPNKMRHLFVLMLISSLSVQSSSFQSSIISPFRTIMASSIPDHRRTSIFPQQGVSSPDKETLPTPNNFVEKKNKNDNDDSFRINLVYLGLATLETVFWWYLAPGINPDSRWFAPDDGVLISNLLNPSIVLDPPFGSGLGFSSLLLNTFLIVPAVWSLLLLQEEEHQILPPLPFCLAGFVVGGGALIPYMILRKSKRTVDNTRFSPVLKFFEEGDGSTLLIGLTIIVLTAFLVPFIFGSSELDLELTAFQERINSSQFTSLALFDFTMLCICILDPMMDDAKRRNYLHQDATLAQAAHKLLPFLVPLVGPVAWIYFRPRFQT
uniref:Uncharacterized protein n=2 Tax=Ditylum brightwellii TaxID=49249 RepID=A0A7S4T599_9STRA